MNVVEARTIVKGTRVMYKPTGELGTVVRIRLRLIREVPSEARSKTLTRYQPVSVLVKLDEPCWMPPIEYHHGTIHAGRKLKDLQIEKGNSNG